jgi:hypothetical protein
MAADKAALHPALSIASIASIVSISPPHLAPKIS